jgi:N-acyl-D-amino-acid deacylase
MRGSLKRAPENAGLEFMKSLVGQAMTAGALGLSTGLINTPGVFAQTEEIVELATIASIHANQRRWKDGVPN